MKRILSISLLLITTTIALNGAFFHAFRQVASKVAPMHVPVVGMLAPSLAAQYHEAPAHEKKRLDANDPELIKTIKAAQKILQIVKEKNRELSPYKNHFDRVYEGYLDPDPSREQTERGLFLMFGSSKISMDLFTPWGNVEIKNDHNIFDELSQRIELQFVREFTWRKESEGLYYREIRGKRVKVIPNWPGSLYAVVGVDSDLLPQPKMIKNFEDYASSEEVRKNLQKILIVTPNVKTKIH